MAHSMRLGGAEPKGSVASAGLHLGISSDPLGSWQTLKTQTSTERFHVDYVIGSGTHASGYLTSIDGHLFQSPVAYYTQQAKYNMAPGFKPDAEADFTRPVKPGCVFCHAGSFAAVAGTENAYRTPPFPHLAIGCERCHGPAADHLRNPTAQNVVNPEALRGAARDSICEQCHLIGAARILNPGKTFADFHAGDVLETTFTVYHHKLPPEGDAGLRVISHSEQLSLSLCKRTSGDRMWCGTCHDPHNEPVEPVSFYRARCLSCHANTMFAANHPAKNSNCISCHMPKRETDDGGHTAFTDHRIQRRPRSGEAVPSGELEAWREPGSALAVRNLGIANIDVGVESRSTQKVIAGYRMLAGVQARFTDDSDLFNSIGNALLLGRQYEEAIEAFRLAVRYEPGSSSKLANLAQAYLSAGDLTSARTSGENALSIDPLNLSAVAMLMEVYAKQGDTAAQQRLSEQVAARFRNRKLH